MEYESKILELTEKNIIMKSVAELEDKYIKEKKHKIRLKNLKRKKKEGQKGSLIDQVKHLNSSKS